MAKEGDPGDARDFGQMRTMDDGKRFPIYRALVALIVVPPLILAIFPFLIFLLGLIINRRSSAAIPGEHWSGFDLLLFPVVTVIYSWPGYIAFALLGLPTLYLLYRWNRVELVLFGAIGAVYTCLAWVLFEFIAQRDPAARAEYMRMTPIWVVAGFIGGVLTRCIVHWRSVPN